MSEIRSAYTLSKSDEDDMDPEAILSVARDATECDALAAQRDMFMTVRALCNRARWIAERTDVPEADKEDIPMLLDEARKLYASAYSAPREDEESDEDIEDEED